MLQPIIDPESVMDFYRGFKEKAVSEDDGVIPMLLFLDCPEMAPEGEAPDPDMRGVAVVVIPTSVATDQLHELFTRLKTDGPLVDKDVLGVALASDTYYLDLPADTTVAQLMEIRAQGSLQNLYREGHPNVSEALSVYVLRQDKRVSVMTVPYGAHDDGSLNWREPIVYPEGEVTSEGTVPEAMAVLLS